MDFRTTKEITHSPVSVHIDTEAVESPVSSSRDSPSQRTSPELTTPQWWWVRHNKNFILRRLTRANLPQKLLVSFYRCTTESILTKCRTAWYRSCTQTDETALQHVVGKKAQHIVGIELPPLEHLHSTCCVRRAKNIIKDITHPGHPSV